MRICFLNYTRPNLRTILPRVRREVGMGHDVEFVFGFDYNEESSNLELPSLPGVRWSTLLTDWVPAGAITDGRPPFSPALYDVIRGARFPKEVSAAVAAAFRARYDWRRIDEAVEKSTAALPHLLATIRPDLLVLPEQTDYLRGAPAARLARQLGIRFEVSLPRYYNAMASYPARADGAYCEWNAISKATPGPGQRKVVLALQGLAWETVILRDLVEVLATLPGLTLVVRPHPHLPVGAIDRLLDGLPKISVEHDRRPRFDFAEYTPVALVAQTSTLLDEAKRSGVNTLSIQYSGFPHELYTPALADERHRVAENKIGLRRALTEWASA